MEMKVEMREKECAEREEAPRHHRMEMKQAAEAEEGQRPCAT